MNHIPDLMSETNQSRSYISSFCILASIYCGNKNVLIHPPLCMCPHHPIFFFSFHTWTHVSGKQGDIEWKFHTLLAIYDFLTWLLFPGFPTFVTSTLQTSWSVPHNRILKFFFCFNNSQMWTVNTVSIFITTSKHWTFYFEKIKLSIHLQLKLWKRIFSSPLFFFTSIAGRYGTSTLERHPETNLLCNIKMRSLLLSPHIILLFSVIGQAMCLGLCVNAAFHWTVDVDGSVEVWVIIPRCWPSRRTEESVHADLTPSPLNCHLAEKRDTTPRKCEWGTTTVDTHTHTPRDLHLSGGVIVIDCAVNSSSKYRVSVSDMTWGLNGGMSCGTKDKK